MSAEIQIAYTETAVTLYATVRNSVGQIWNTAGAAFEAYQTANVTDYDVALAEQGTASRFYVGDMPAVGDGVFSVTAHKRAGGSPAEGDPVVGMGDLQFRGSAVPSFDSILDDTEDVQSKLGSPSDLGSGATVAGNLVDIEAQTDDIGVAGAGLSAIPWNAAWDAEVESEVSDALAAYDAPTHAELVSEINSVQSDIAALNDIAAADVWAAGTRTLTSLGTGTIVAATFGAGAIDAAALATDAANEIADAMLDRTAGVETGYTLRQAQRIILSAVAGESSGHTSGASSPIYRDVNDTKARITATTDANGNRTAITLDAT